MLRIFLFLATNAAVLVLISVVFRLFGIDGLLQENGVALNLSALLIMSAVIGFGGPRRPPSGAPERPARPAQAGRWARYRCVPSS